MNISDDGVGHINIYSKSLTELGRRLSNFMFSPIDLSDDGHFDSIEGYWYWLSAHEEHPEREKLRRMIGFPAKDLGRKLESGSLDDKVFREKIIKALMHKLLAHDSIWQELKASTLPFKHYYVFDGQIKDAQNSDWWATIWDRLRAITKMSDSWVIDETELPNQTFDFVGPFLREISGNSDGQ